MPNWYCSRCSRRQPSNVYPILASGRDVWPDYSRTDVHADPNDKLCSRCHLDTRKAAGKLPNKPIRTPMLRRPCNCSGACKFSARGIHDEPDTSESQDMSSISNRSESSPSRSPLSLFEDLTDFSQDSTSSWNAEGSLIATISTSTASCSETLSSISIASNCISRRTIPGMKSVVSTQRKCCICSSLRSRKVVPQAARMQMWAVNRIWIPAKNRCCSSHLEKGMFTEAALLTTTASSEDTEMEASQASELISVLSDLAFQKGQLVDFDNSDLTEEDYLTLTGYPQSVFDQLVDHCKELHHSSNRSKRNAVGLLLIQLRLNLTQRVLQFLFNIKNRSTVSETLESVLCCLEKNFVPKYLGYNHISRKEIIEKHSIPVFEKLLMSRLDEVEEGDEDRKLQLIFDGTYLFIQKSTNFETQRRTFSMQKSRNLVKPMMIVTTTGYILEASDVYFTDHKNNDAAILKHLMTTTGLLKFFEVGDHAIVDRGFRDVIAKLQDYGVYTHMPELLPKTDKQFPALKGDKSRKVTMIRWIVEAVNGRVKKKFRFFDEVIKNPYLPKVGRLFRLACSIINAFSAPIFSSSEDHTSLVLKATSNLNKENSLYCKLEAEKLLTSRSNWVPATKNSIPDFPRLSTDDLTQITLGVYQVRMAKLYAEQHMKHDGEFNIFVHREQPTLFKAKLQSRFSGSPQHKMWIQYEPNIAGANSVTGLYCTCKTGARTIGTCSHLTLVLWFFGYGGHQESVPKRRTLASGILDAAEKYADTGRDNTANDDENVEPSTKILF